MRSKITRFEIAAVATVAVLGFGLIRTLALPRQENFNRSFCQSSLKQIGLAMMQYGQDADETWPRAWYGRDAGPSNAKTNSKWMDVIRPYLKNDALFHCLSDPREYRFRDGTNYGSYVINNAYFAANDKLTPPAGQKMSKLVHPTNTILLTDGDGDFQFAWSNIATTPVWTTTSPRQLDSSVERHSNFTNTLFCDGHVANYGALQIFGDRNLKGRKFYSGLTIEDD